VVLALAAQTAGFGQVFRVFAIGLAAGGLVLGSLSELRVGRNDTHKIRFATPQS